MVDQALSFGYEPHLVRCARCGRKILVEIALNGNSHNVHVSATCGECLRDRPLSAGFRGDHPMEARMIEEWLLGDG
jgi:hypothetical protein